MKTFLIGAYLMAGIGVAGAGVDSGEIDGEHFPAALILWPMVLAYEITLDLVED